ncbi:hypothetical protein NX801_00090 [Streptomyces sp. LP05-1]|uniref:Secreted protein n=1 Tax=Streptomyces pyxinae TaxID=2970734 RepID=A0ABT2C9L5_9ACTN|nr:hypothetical protein [Streptomyces sp. LP05-1]MCS0634087.1 hypothetical protein [Streptomyces sp. LP05-1]
MRARGALLAGLVGTVAALGGTLATTTATATTRTATTAMTATTATTATDGTTTAGTAAVAPAGAPATATAGDDTPPPAVEDFAYPDAGRLLAEKGIALRQGDGHILLTDCAAPHQIQVWTLQNAEGRYCFRVTGKTGYLALEVKRVHAIRTDDRAVRAKLTVDGQSTTVDIPKDDYKPVGEGDQKDPRPAVLVELRVTA